jgi:hypothetical protein
MDALNESLVRAIADCQKQVHDVVGFALIVDADMSSVFGVSVDRRFIDESGCAELIYTPVDWPTEHHTEGFRQASERLSQWTKEHRESDYERRVCEVAEVFAEALHRARTLVPSLERTLLLVVCADGGGPWQSAEEESVRRLNGATVYEAWRDTLSRPV